MLHGRVCFPRRSHLRLDDQHAAQSPCLAILVPLGMWRFIDNKLHRGSGGGYIPYPRSTGPDHAALHPLRRDAPDQKGCNAYGSGAPPHRQQARPRAIPPDRPQPSASDTATRPRHAHPGSEREALHHLASITPPPSWCNTPLSGVTPLSNKPTRGEARPLALPTSHRPNQTGQPCTRYVAIHPLRRCTPDQKGCTAYGSGASPPKTSIGVEICLAAPVETRGNSVQRRPKRRFAIDKQTPATTPLTAASKRG